MFSNYIELIALQPLYKICRVSNRFLNQAIVLFQAIDTMMSLTPSVTSRYPGNFLKSILRVILAPFNHNSEADSAAPMHAHRET